MTFADRLYNELVDHHRTCTQCTDTTDCAVGLHLLMAWGRAESAVEQSVEGWWRPDAERRAIRDGRDIPDVGERTAND